MSTKQLETLTARIVRQVVRTLTLKNERDELRFDLSALTDEVLDHEVKEHGEALTVVQQQLGAMIAAPTYDKLVRKDRLGDEGDAAIEELNNADLDVREKGKAREDAYLALGRAEKLHEQEEREGWPKREVTDDDLRVLRERSQETHEAYEAAKEHRDEVARRIRRDFVAVRLGRISDYTVKPTVQE